MAAEGLSTSETGERNGRLSSSLGAPTIAVALALAMLVVFLIPGVLLCDSSALGCFGRDPSGSGFAAGLQGDVVDSLERQLEGLQEKLTKPPSCTAANPHGGGVAAPAPGGGATATVGPQTAKPPASNPLAIPPASDSPAPARPASVPGSPLGARALLEVVDPATVLVIAVSRSGQRIDTGTGFFINDRQLVTNQHVVGDADPNKIIVMNPKVGRLKAKVVAATENAPPPSRDFAVLQVDQPVAVKPLDLAMKVQRLQPIVSAGYPGMILKTDPAFRQLMETGDVAAMPALVPSTGIVAAIQHQQNTEVVVHSATLYPGNSGGPLLDNCGGVVGVNTFIMADQQLARGTQYALASNALGSFLRSKNIRFNQAADCSEARTEPTPTPAPPPAAR